MYFNAISKNKILAKISEFTVLFLSTGPRGLKLHNCIPCGKSFPNKANYIKYSKLYDFVSMTFDLWPTFENKLTNDSHIRP